MRTVRNLVSFAIDAMVDTVRSTIFDYLIHNLGCETLRGCSFLLRGICVISPGLPDHENGPMLILTRISTISAFPCVPLEHHVPNRQLLAFILFFFQGDDLMHYEGAVLPHRSQFVHRALMSPDTRKVQ